MACRSETDFLLGFLLSFFLDSGEFCHQLRCVIFIIIVVRAAVSVLQQKLIIDLWREGGEREMDTRARSERERRRERERDSLRERKRERGGREEGRRERKR